jgi:hypothetical protein
LILAAHFDSLIETCNRKPDWTGFVKIMNISKIDRFSV